MAAGRKRNQIRHAELQSREGDTVFYQDSDVFVVMCFAAAVLVLLHADEA